MVPVGLCDADVLRLTLGVGVEEVWGLDEAVRTDARDGVPVWHGELEEDIDTEFVIVTIGDCETEVVYVCILEIVLETVDDTDTDLDALEHVLADLDLVGEDDTVTLWLVVLVFRGEALDDLADVVLRDIREDEEGVVVWDWETVFLDVAVVQIVEVVLWDGEPVLVDELDTELLSEDE